MTREIAIITLQDMWETLFNEMTNHTFDDLQEHGMLDNYRTAFDMAISALSTEREKGEWVYDGDCIHCNNCKSAFNNLTGFNFCPNCGVDMRGEK